MSLEDLSKKAGTSFLKQGTFTQNTLAQASSIYANLKSSLLTIQDTRQKEQRLQILQSSLVRMQGQLTTHSWLHENCLVQNNMMMNSGVLRTKFILDLRNNTAALGVLVNQMGDAREQYQKLVNVVTTRYVC